MILRISGEWGVRHQILSVAFPHSITAGPRLEWKQLKDWLQTTPAHMQNSTLNKFQRAILQYRNAPDQDTKLSPAMLFFKHPISDVQLAKI